MKNRHLVCTRTSDDDPAADRGEPLSSPSRLDLRRTEPVRGSSSTSVPSPKVETHTESGPAAASLGSVPRAPSTGLFRLWDQVAVRRLPVGPQPHRAERTDDPRLLRPDLPAREQPANGTVDPRNCAVPEQTDVDGRAQKETIDGLPHGVRVLYRLTSMTGSSRSHHA